MELKEILYILVMTPLALILWSVMGAWIFYWFGKGPMTK